ncbi:hypothetical protein JCM33374_g958 [Metschnikowia sp. JCM 33374]|nr:hypothetical protein JCM33374_g958 [Metschnikowia sp. JCM 33374]
MKCLIPLNNIRLAEVPYVENFNPDFPLANQQSVVVARISANEAYAGLLYHPEYLIETLKRFFAHSSNISFTSVGSESTVPSMVRNLPGKVFWINLTGGRTTSGFSLTGRGFSNNDMVIQSKVCSFEPMLPSFGKHSAGVSGIPRTVLWIPFLKTSFAPGIEPRLRCQTSTSGNITSIDISSGVDSALADEVNQRYDLLYCLRVCGYVLDCVGEISHIMSRL